MSVGPLWGSNLYSTATKSYEILYVCERLPLYTAEGESAWIGSNLSPRDVRL